MIREYIYAYTAVCPETGETYSIIAPLTNTGVMNLFLKAVSRAYKSTGSSCGLDAAGWHTSRALELPENIRLLVLPPCSPELNPTEHIWDYIREQKEFNNHVFTSLDQVEEQLAKALKEINTEKQTINSLCNFNWIKAASC